MDEIQETSSHQIDPADHRSTPNPPPIKRGSACKRCRLQKVRCDSRLPACSNCVKAGAECVKSKAAEIEASKNYIEQLEKRTRWLEDILYRNQPDAILEDIGNQQLQDGRQYRPNAPHFDQQIGDHHNYPLSSLGDEALNVRTTTSLPANSPAASHTSQIGPSQPLAHDVGLLSLANSTEPKYLGPSSGVTFARLIFASAPQSQGLSSSWLAAEKGPFSGTTATQQSSQTIAFAELPRKDEMRYFVDAYFDQWQPLYPFLDEESFQDLIDRTYSYQTTELHSKAQSKPKNEVLSQSFDLAQVFLVLALGARTLESRLSTDFSSDQYYATAMFHVGKIQLHDSIRGVQILLLLVLSSFSFTNGLNAWFLTSTIMASCLDLGLQRKHVDGSSHMRNSLPGAREDISRLQELRSGVFWSAYSLDRTLSVILGRPLTLRDEAIDIEYPGEYESQEIDHNAVTHRRTSSTTTPAQEPQRKRICIQQPSTAPPRSQTSYLPAIYSFRFDRITAEIKLMIYRVAQSPARFPWPTNLIEWQEQTREACSELLDNARNDLKWRRTARSRGLPEQIMHVIELKYHQCIMILNRPSPAFQQPSFPALRACYESALETIRIQSELHRFANFINSWLTAHAVFVSGITMLYCLWTSPQIRRETSLKNFMHHADSCTKLLIALGKTWSVAEDARTKFERLVQLTADNWKQNRSGTITPAMHNQLQQQQNLDDNNPGGLQLMDGYQPADNLPMNFWDQDGGDYSQGSNMIIDELGDIGSWFDLEWLEDATYAISADLYNVQ